MFVITGGGSGIGRALAHALVARGKEVLIVGRRELLLIESATVSPLISYFCVDISTHKGREQILSRLKDTLKIEGLIHNAGIIKPISPITQIKESDWRQIMATNVEAPLFLSQLLYDKLLGGRLLHLGSGAAYFPIVGWSAYCVSKAALSMLTRCWQLECKEISCASVMPGITDTAMQEEVRDASFMESEKLDFFKRLQRDNQLLSPATVALFLCWLLLDVDKRHYVSKEWDIYDSAHHAEWLVPPHTVYNPWE